MIRRTLLAFTLAGLGAAAFAQTAPTAPGPWPARPVKILVGASAGGGTDIIARLLADKMQSSLGQPFVVENRPGAGNTIASDVTAKSAPDGYTLLVGTNTAQAIAPHIMKLGFDPIRDLTPIALLVVVPNVVVVAPTVAATNIRDLVTEIKAKPGGFSCGSSGIGSTQHLACESFAMATGTKIVHIPYKGSAGALTDLVGGQIQLDFDTTSSAMSFIKGGKVKALAVMTPRRSSELPDVPTLAEAGVQGVEMSTWYGLFGPANLPRDITAKLHDEAMRILALPDVRKKLEAMAGEPGALTAQEFAAMAKSDYERSGKLVREANIKAEQ
ncbi:MAG TPA: tripartite tricarboxylate transporter substrate binding protein [Usitatibacter sp.]|nr:tripartite tricarboxylate transporter substrate binding protein [Usitatibacter sp.]